MYWWLTRDYARRIQEVPRFHSVKSVVTPLLVTLGVVPQVVWCFVLLKSSLPCVTYHGAETRATLSGTAAAFHLKRVYVLVYPASDLLLCQL